MQFFNTRYIALINERIFYFGIDLPSQQIAKRSEKLAKNMHVAQTFSVAICLCTPIKF